MKFIDYKIKEISKVMAGGDKPKVCSDVYSDETPIPIYSNGMENEGLYGYTDVPKVEGDTVTISARGVNVGKVCYRETPFLPIVRLLSLIPDRKLIYVKYLYYYLKTVNISGTGSAQPQVTVPMISDLQIHIHKDIDEQKKIASFLSTLDDKIKINNQINRNLSDLLQAIYQEQFSNVSLSKNQGILSDICSYSKAKVAVSELNTNTYFSTENMLPGKAGSIEATSLPAMTRTTACHKGDTLISNIRPYFKKIVYCEDVCGCSSDVLCFTPVQFQYAAYLFSTLHTDKFFTFMVAGSKGTKMPRGDKQQIMTYPLILPSEKELEEFNAVAVLVLEQLNYNRTENKRLSALRDALLPKLMSGELDVSALDF